ncbi:MAG: hypothetical protein GKC04_08440 [Methanomicrobiales archaeon]|nr:hypothetical protein [Methanomicrobiales archaeon]
MTTNGLLPVSAVLLAGCLLCALPAAAVDALVPQETLSVTLAEGLYTDLYALAPAPDGGFYVGGLGYRPGSADNALLVRYAPDGTVTWQQRFEGDIVTACVPDTGDGYICTVSESPGMFSAAETAGNASVQYLSADGTARFGVPLPGKYASACVPRSGGGCAVAGWSWADSSGFLGEYDADGTLIRELTFAGLVPYALAAAPGGGYVLAGATTARADTPTDAWLLAVDASGAELWRREYAGRAAFSLLPLGGGGWLVAGSTESYPSFAGSAWYLAADEEGNGEIVQTEGLAFYGASPLAGGGYLLAGKWGNSGMLRVIGEDGREGPLTVLNATDGRINALAAMPDGTVLAAGWERSGSSVSGVVRGYIVSAAAPAQETAAATTPASAGTPAAYCAAAGAIALGARLRLRR